jgi:hypothetical protein
MVPYVSEPLVVPRSKGVILKEKRKNFPAAKNTMRQKLILGH